MITPSSDICQIKSQIFIYTSNPFWEHANIISPLPSIIPLIPCLRVRPSICLQIWCQQRHRDTWHHVAGILPPPVGRCKYHPHQTRGWAGRSSPRRPIERQGYRYLWCLWPIIWINNVNMITLKQKRWFSYTK